MLVTFVEVVLHRCLTTLITFYRKYYQRWCVLFTLPLECYTIYNIRFHLVFLVLSFCLPLYLFLPLSYNKNLRLLLLDILTALSFTLMPQKLPYPTPSCICGAPSADLTYLLFQCSTVGDRSSLYAALQWLHVKFPVSSILMLFLISG
ncbi:hypothetical protein PR048_019900 [Dryococelus australis]|uniref:Uncharacterized protein n=1 Tax=Dryococelus australis TaxID=614101 RepID=A0ABQ9H4T6_9NEOP|nr:hypothetical protein PR048_019900 [Dryococelus australis]